MKSVGIVLLWTIAKKTPQLRSFFYKRNVGYEKNPKKKKRTQRIKAIAEIRPDCLVTMLDILINFCGRTNKLIPLSVAIHPRIVIINPRCSVHTLYDKIISIPTMSVIHAARKVSQGLLIKSSKIFFISDGERNVPTAIER